MMTKKKRVPLHSSRVFQLRHYFEKKDESLKAVFERMASRSYSLLEYAIYHERFEEIITEIADILKGECSASKGFIVNLFSDDPPEMVRKALEESVKRQLVIKTLVKVGLARFHAPDCTDQGR